MCSGMRIACLLVVAACSPTLTDGGDDDDTASFSPIGQHVIAALESGHKAARGQTWEASTDNALDAGWVIQTPLPSYWGQPVSSLVIAAPCTGDAACDPDFGLLACSSQADCRFGGTCAPVASTVAKPGQPVRNLCVGHSDTLYDDIYSLVVTAKSTVEITSLSPPDGRFEAALRNAITYLSHSGAAVRVRVLWGAIPGAELSGATPAPADVLQSLARDVDPTAPLRVGVAALRASVVSWNHAKIVAVDGETAIVGGHNMWTKHYLQQAPVHDISMRVSGGAALSAAKFSDVLWHHTCQPPTNLDASAEIAAVPTRDAVCESTPFPASSGAGGARVVTVARLGTMGDLASDDAMVALIDSAKTQIRISQQDIGPIGAGAEWPEPYLRALSDALARGVDIELVVSNVGATPGGLVAGSSSYSNGWTPGDVVARLADYATANGTDISQSLCSHFHATSLRPGPDDAWPDGTTFANHAKLAIVDDSAFYIGSQNWYPANLFELGYIVDDPDAARQLVDAYYSKVWASSSRVMAACTP
jgi:phosphatidylserine/phosphatidylglycerophosphate/cardiolipin synthase-like enzyme